MESHWAGYEQTNSHRGHNDETLRYTGSRDNRLGSWDEMSRASYNTCDTYGQRPGNFEAYASSSRSLPRIANQGPWRQANNSWFQESLPYRQGPAIPIATALDLVAAAPYSQEESDHYTSSSMSSSPTPRSTTSSQMNAGPQHALFTSHRSSIAQKQRYWLYIRQQPRAGRACNNSRDRRPIDPPPILQLQISDFDPGSLDDMDDMRDQSFIVKCLLCSPSGSKRDVSVVMCRDESSGATKAEKQINGNLDASPFFCDEDPDPSTAPRHPSSQLYHPLQTTSSSVSRRNLPATFFCFSDLSIRRAGVYRLEFQLMRIRLDQQAFQVLHSVVSEPFNVVNAKDFDHVQPSTSLVRGLVARGAGFPLKLKQGSRAQRNSLEE